MKQIIYADNAATTKLDKDAFEAMLPWLTDEYGNASQAYSFARKPKQALKEARETIASCIGALPEEIFFTSGGTESDNWAIKGATLADNRRHGALITSAFEHHAVLKAAEAVETLLYPVAYMWPSNEGMVTPTKLSQYISDETKMVSIMMVNNEIGTVQPINELCNIAHEHGALFHTDAVQAVGHMDIDVNALGIDLLSASAHKFNGPKGIGFLYVRKGTKLLSYMDGGAQEHGKRAGTENVASIVAMAVALKKNCSIISESQIHLRKLEGQLLQGLDKAGILYHRNGKGNILPGLLSLSFPGKEGEAILHRMDLMGISVSTGSACNSKSTEVSHVLKAIDLGEKFAKGTIRISLSKHNTEEEVARIVASLIKIVS